LVFVVIITSNLTNDENSRQRKKRMIEYGLSLKKEILRIQTTKVNREYFFRDEKLNKLLILLIRLVLMMLIDW